MEIKQIKNIIEAALLAAGEPVTIKRLLNLFSEHELTHNDIAQALEQLGQDFTDRGIELIEVANGFRLQTKTVLQPWITRLWEEKPKKYSRALLETLALIAYRQPVTRGEIEDVRGVAVSSYIIRTLMDREWIQVLGYRDVPGKPAMFGTTGEFLDYFNMKSLQDLPTLAEIKDIEVLIPELNLEPKIKNDAFVAQFNHTNNNNEEE
ncbi:Segregation and condensation protein B [hydrothermal vent metagenome]|uniref:Segregation and condensation protein B n=1 Tax=hydrothermal vent metagenome TaxID=652676 RepID=A0A3B0V052_9ZZZZ